MKPFSVTVLAVGAILTSLALLPSQALSAPKDQPLAADQIDVLATKTLDITNPSLVLQQGDGKRCTVLVSLSRSLLQMRLWVTDELGTPLYLKGTKRLYCWELKSEDPKVPFVWSLLSPAYFGRFSIVTDAADRPYLSCVQGRWAYVSPLASPQERGPALKAYLSGREAAEGMVRVPVEELVGSQPFVGLDATTDSITVLSAERDGAGIWTVTVTGDKQELLYTLRSNPSAKPLGWELVSKAPMPAKG